MPMNKTAIPIACNSESCRVFFMPFFKNSPIAPPIITAMVLAIVPKPITDKHFLENIVIRNKYIITFNINITHKLWLNFKKYKSCVYKLTIMIYR